MPIQYGLDLLFKMDLPQIIIPRCFSKEINSTILAEFIHELSEFKFDGEGESTFRDHLFQVVWFSFCHRICSKYVISRLLTLTFEVHVSQWCHTLPIASIHSFN